MPELPEVETVVRAIRPYLLGKTIRAIDPLTPKLRTPLDKQHLRKSLIGKRIEEIRRRGKYIVVECSETICILIHLGVTGAFRICQPDEAIRPHDRVRIRLNKKEEWRFMDPRRFGLFEVRPLPGPGKDPDALADLGPEPLSRAFSGRYLFEQTRTRTAAVKAVLMDQNTVAGPGNIYASEACFYANIDPGRPAGSLSEAECGSLVKRLKAVLRSAIKQGGTTIRDFQTPSGEEGWFRIRLKVYGRDGQPCKTCGATIVRSVIAGRSTFYCPHCQR